MKINLSEQELNGLLNYLASKPWIEANQLISILDKAIRDAKANEAAAVADEEVKADVGE